MSRFFITGSYEVLHDEKDFVFCQLSTTHNGVSFIIYDKVKEQIYSIEFDYRDARDRFYNIVAEHNPVVMLRRSLQDACDYITKYVQSKEDWPLGIEKWEALIKKTEDLEKS